MRVPAAVLDFLRERFRKVAPGARLFLFGSRNDDAAKGGDIDVLVLSRRRIPARALRLARIAFCERFGEQRLDLLNFRFADESPFKQLAMLEGTEFS